MNIFLFQVTYLSELEYSTQNKQDKICMRTNNKQIYVLITSSYFVFNFYRNQTDFHMMMSMNLFHIKHLLNGLHTIVIKIKDKTKLKINCHHPNPAAGVMAQYWSVLILSFLILYHQIFPVCSSP